MTVRLLAATGSVGLAPTDPARSFAPALSRQPHAIVADAGSADVGPGFLGSGRAYNNPEWEEAELGHLIEGASRLGVPLIVGSCGVHGADAGVEAYSAMAERAARRLGRRLRLALIFSEQPRAWLQAALARGTIESPGGLPPLTAEAVDASSRLVAAMGAEPIVAALAQGADVVLAGRACDDALFAAPCLRRGINPASSFLAGKLLENASLVASPFVIREAVLAEVDDDGVTLEPMLADQRCTRASVAAQLMYERRTPLSQPGPRGMLELGQVRIQELDARRARISGASYCPTQPTLKVEGAGIAGQRSVALVGIRDPGLIAALDTVAAEITTEVETSGAQVALHVFGRDATMGAFEPTPAPGHEVALLIETLAATQQQASSACLLARRRLFASGYPGQKATAGSVSGLGDELWEAGAAYRWTVNHIVPVDDPSAQFVTEIREVGSGA
ncbi:MAG: acyclic terpene utilization AtuA family protein [Actinomycetia bacterium]|nr:acyclic terpene utilization AtuA family protein [Actinomycetes bacterium]